LWRHGFHPGLFLTLRLPGLVLWLASLILLPHLVAEALLLLLGFGPVNRAGRVLGRCVNRIELERAMADVDKVMPFAGGYHYYVAVCDPALKI
jgi:hypothetical protein